MPEYFYTVYQSPLGPLHLLGSSKGLVALCFTKKSFDGMLKRHFAGTRPERSEKRFKPIAKQLDAYFKGLPVKFVFTADIRSGTKFQRAVWGKLSELLPGQLTTYGSLAREVKRPKASRAVGQAVGANPLPIIIPCHRVISSSGKLGGFTGGIGLKKKLLSIEGIKL
ncbi:methylated-DNA--[protein]-cysteine S-methyltransferase [candidate division TA06 bacterium]|nr:methylated-DNA--[protein]-cysteine S-methyltransferase [candidate division TA06 bacterium]